MKYTLILFCTLVFSVAAQAQVTCSKACGAQSCISKKDEAKATVRLQTNGQNITASIKETEPRPLYFYLFDVEGTMIHQAVLAKEKTTRVNDLKRGTYIYTVFANDVSIDEGKIEIR